MTNVALTIGEAIHMYDFHLKSIYLHVFMVLLLGTISMDVRNLEGTDTMQTLFNHLFVPASCAMLNVSATKTGVLWGKCYTSSFLAMHWDIHVLHL